MNDNLSSRLASLRIERVPAGRSVSRRRRTGLIVGVLAAIATLVTAALVLPIARAALFPIEVTVSRVNLVTPSQAITQFMGTGYVQAVRSSRLAPKVSGRVLRSHVEQGAHVDVGQLLIELDPADHLAAIQLAERQVETALAESESERAEARVARAELRESELSARRARRLSDSGVASRGEAESLAARAQSMKQKLQAAHDRTKVAKARAEELRARVRLLRTELTNLSLFAPFHGVVVNEPPRVGEYVGPQPPGVTVDMGGIHVADLSSLIVEADIPEQRFRLIEPEGPAEIALDAYADKKFEAHVSTVTPEVDRAKATVRVKVAFSSPAPGVLPDMAARVSFLSKDAATKAEDRRPRKVVQGAAVVQRDGMTFVYVVEGERVRMQPVRLGSAIGDGLELLDGPATQTVVVNDVPSDLKDGSEVRVIEQ
jgi:RND family efflux transporter MFP subunit